MRNRAAVGSGRGPSADDTKEVCVSVKGRSSAEQRTGDF